MGVLRELCKTGLVFVTDKPVWIKICAYFCIHLDTFFPEPIFSFLFFSDSIGSLAHVVVFK